MNVWKYIFSLFQLHDRYQPVCLTGDYISYVEYISQVHWPLAKLHNIDRETREVISEKGGRYSLSYKPILYLARETGGRSLLSVQEECKLIKSRSAIQLYNNADPMIRTVRQFEERAVDKRFSSLISGADKFGNFR